MISCLVSLPANRGVALTRFEMDSVHSIILHQVKVGCPLCHEIPNFEISVHLALGPSILFSDAGQTSCSVHL